MDKGKNDQIKLFTNKEFENIVNMHKLFTSIHEPNKKRQKCLSDKQESDLEDG